MMHSTEHKRFGDIDNERTSSHEYLDRYLRRKTVQSNINLEEGETLNLHLLCTVMKICLETQLIGYKVGSFLE